jgi:hypothetical protein
VLDDGVEQPVRRHGADGPPRAGIDQLVPPALERAAEEGVGDPHRKVKGRQHARAGLGGDERLDVGMRHVEHRNVGCE